MKKKVVYAYKDHRIYFNVFICNALQLFGKLSVYASLKET